MIAIMMMIIITITAKNTVRKAMVAKKSLNKSKNKKKLKRNPRNVWIIPPF